MNKQDTASDSVAATSDKIDDSVRKPFEFLPNCKIIPLERDPKHVKEEKHFRWLVPMGSWCRIPSSVWTTKVDFRNEAIEKAWKLASEKEGSVQLFCFVQEVKAMEFKDAEKSAGMTVLTILRHLEILAMETAIAKSRIFASYFTPAGNSAKFPPFSLTRKENCIEFCIRKEDEYDFKMFFYYATPPPRPSLWGENSDRLYEYQCFGKNKDYILSEAKMAMCIIKTCWHTP